jgi:serine/threonine protein phosphatase PrpC
VSVAPRTEFPESVYAVAGQIVDWANEQGGHDNITVALGRVEADDLPGSTPATDASQTHAAHLRDFPASRDARARSKSFSVRSCSPGNLSLITES